MQAGEVVPWEEEEPRGEEVETGRLMGGGGQVLQWAKPRPGASVP